MSSLLKDFEGLELVEGTFTSNLTFVSLKKFKEGLETEEDLWIKLFFPVGGVCLIDFPKKFETKKNLEVEFSIQNYFFVLSFNGEYFYQTGDFVAKKIK